MKEKLTTMGTKHEQPFEVIYADLCQKRITADHIRHYERKRRP